MLVVTSLSTIVLPQAATLDSQSASLFCVLFENYFTNTSHFFCR